YSCSRGGAVKAVAHPAFLLAAVALAAWTTYADLSPWWFTGVASLVGAAVYIAGIQRHRCAMRTKALITNASASALTTHVIAHSFGTYLAVRAMAMHDILFARVVFVGCVLPRRFNWHTLFKRASGPSRVKDVRNEIGSSDFVVRLAGFTTWLTRELGSAGRTGFLPVGHKVHSISNPWHECQECSTSAAARVHNVTLEEYGHSTWALGIGHALHFWLPYLWGYPPAEFRNWLNVCSQATRGLQTAAKDDYVHAVGFLLRHKWTWTRKVDGTPRTLETYLADQIGDEATVLSVQAEVMRRLVHAVYLAQQAATEDAPYNEKIRWRLDPKLAIDYTLADVRPLVS
ncbi:MAG: hypothetical protein OXK79_00045, partial [Chloroflexota bacterium]|nr:hypothetical protein [Chloroflexota bacterium]